ncbi:MAG: DUF192 domain-containing protein [Phycisphaeraceae bacterium]|nr:DUF192 domain-containing protein [Phycisphaeraceae bacterium]
MATRSIIRCHPPTAIVLLAACLLAACSRTAAPTTQPSAIKATIAGQPFTLELALDDAAHYRGLSGRSHLAPDAGMLFVFAYPRELNFVMRDCLVPIDVIFLSPAGRIIEMHAMVVEPPGTPELQLTRYPSRWPAQYALELPGGSIERLDLKPGQKLDLPLDSLKPLSP